MVEKELIDLRRERCEEKCETKKDAKKSSNRIEEEVATKNLEISKV